MALQVRGEGLAKVGQVRAGRGREPAIPADKVEQIVRRTQHEKPSGATHWSCRSMARKASVSPATVQRVWSGRGLGPGLAWDRTWSRRSPCPTTPAFEEKLADVVGLYLNPPEQAVVPCMDEKTCVQAPDRTSPRCR